MEKYYESNEPEYEVTPEIRDHMDTYKPYFDNWNSDEPYKPSFLFGYQERVARFLSKFVDTHMEPKEVMKELLVAAFSTAAIILILAIAL